MKTITKTIPALFLLVLVAGCGVVLNDTRVQPVDQTETTRAEPLPVEIVPVSPATIRLANATPYEARQLPESFFHFPRARTAPGAGTLPRPTAAASAAHDLQTRLPASLEPRPYLIGETDILRLRRENGPNGPDGPLGPEFSNFLVSASGDIRVRGLGVIEVADLTTAEAEERINRALTGIGTEQRAELEISEFRARRVGISGSVRNPLLASLNEQPLYLDEAIQIAGGTTLRSPDHALVRLLRGRESYQIPLNALQGSEGLVQIPLQDGDRVVVEPIRDIDEERAWFDQTIRLQETDLNRRRAVANDARNAYLSALNIGAIPRDYVYLAGALTVQGRFTLPLHQGAVVADALFAESRGLERRDGDPRHIYIIRASGVGDEVLAYWLDTRNAAMLVMATQLELRPRDVVFGSNQPITDWNRVVVQILPSFTVLQQATDVIARSRDF